MTGIKVSKIAAELTIPKKTAYEISTTNRLHHRSHFPGGLYGVDSSILPQLGLLLGIPLGYCVWKRLEKSRRVNALINAELREYREKISQQEVKPGQIIFLRRSDGAFVTEWTTGWATIIKNFDGYVLSNYAKDTQGRETYYDTPPEPGTLTMQRSFQSEEAACQHLSGMWFGLDILSPGTLELNWPGNLPGRILPGPIPP
jgi:hypothetical protein